MNNKDIYIADLTSFANQLVEEVVKRLEEDNFHETILSLLKESEHDSNHLKGIFKAYMDSFLGWKNKYSQIIGSYFYLVDKNTGELLLNQVRLIDERPKIIKYYIGLTDGILLLQGFRKFITGQDIKMAVTLQDTGKNFTLNSYIQNMDIIDENILIDFLEQISKKKEQTKISVTNFLKNPKYTQALYAKIEALSDFNELITEAAILQEIEDRMDYYITQIELSPKEDIKTIFRPVSEDNNEAWNWYKNFKRGPFFINENQKERWDQWSSNGQAVKTYTESMIQSLGYKGPFSSNKQKIYKLFAFNSSYTNLYSLYANMGHQFEALLHGAASINLPLMVHIKKNENVDTVDNVMIEAHNQTPFYSGADIYFQLYAKETQEGKKEVQFLGLQAKARNATMSGATVFNIINDLIDVLNLGTESEFISFLIDNFTTPDNKELKKQEISRLIQVMKKSILT